MGVDENPTDNFRELKLALNCFDWDAATKQEIKKYIEECISDLETGVKNEAIGVQEAFEEVWKECPEVKVILYGALTRQKELLFKILGIKYRPVRSVEELRRLLEGEGGEKETKQ